MTDALHILLVIKDGGDVDGKKAPRTEDRETDSSRRMPVRAISCVCDNANDGGLDGLGEEA